MGVAGKGIEMTVKNLRKALSKSKSVLRRLSGLPAPKARSAAPLVFTPEMLRLNRSAAEREHVEAAVHPSDFIYWYWVMESGQMSADGINGYFEDGGHSAAKLAGLLTELGIQHASDKLKLLEFASGYGMVTRQLIKCPQFDVVSCDIHQDAMDFLADKLAVKTMLSVKSPEQFSPSDKYDVVFALSFFSHMPKRTWGRWLKALYGTLRAPGYLVFTTHGLKSKRLSGDEIPADGFWFAPHSEQKDIETAEYGDAMTTPDFVIGEIYRQTRAPIVSYKHGGWWGHQDVWIIKRDER
jgi:cyclopropane fatty-acyl-phospholipid synthase-like methyltransferase